VKIENQEVAMKNYLGIVLLAGFMVITSVWKHTDGEQREAARIFRARQSLIAGFLQLNLADLLNQKDEYLETLNAGYDRDNQRFFIEQPFAGSNYHDAGMLILVSYQRPDEAEICIYAPEHLSWQWLRSRVRRCGANINAPILFEPMLQPEDLQAHCIPLPQTRTARRIDQ